MNKTSVSHEFAGKTLTFETGDLAIQATSSILARLGDTMVLVTVVEGQDRPDIDYFPLSVEYVERLYAGGKIKGSRWVKREGRPSDEAILIGRLIDRSIRPLFPKEYKNEVQVVVTVLSVDGENEPDILALNAVSAALAISRIPWKGPIGAIRVGLVDDANAGAEYLLNPTTSEQALSELDIVASQTKEKTHMIEAGAMQVPENLVEEAVKRAHAETAKMISFIEELVAKIGQEKTKVLPNVAIQETAALLEKNYKSEILALAKARAEKETGGAGVVELVDAIFEQEKTKDPAADIDKKVVKQALEKVMFKAIRADVVAKQKRVDGRKIDELRPLRADVSVLPRTHGSAIFQRGLTQILTIATLGSPRMEQIIESAEGEEIKRYIHHYSFPPYSVGETGRTGFLSRREIGHGALAERALLPVIPDKDKFPYTVRLVSETLSSNGSTSMASTCGSTLALMDAGVPIEAPVAGISIGMMSDGDKYVLLTDIIGLEDFSGDMDFKVAGTEKGITAIQLDVKIDGLTVEQVAETFARARTARMQILEKMLSVIPAYREEISEYAPKVELIQIPVEKIGEVIGPGGKMIKSIIAQTGADVDVEDDGTVTVSGVSDEAVQKASDWVRGITRDVFPGEVFEGEVKRILPFGAFVEYLPGKEGMVHVSKMSTEYVKDPSEVVTLGDKVKVRVEEKDQQGRINLSMIFGEGGEQPPREPREPRESSGRDFGERQRFDRPRENRGFSGRPSGGGGRGTFERRDERDVHPLSRQLRRESQEQRGGGGRKFTPKKRFR